MIRIDEIYNNVFLPKIQAKKNIGLHWFEPFGTTDFSNICNLPPIIDGSRYIFWDQEPLHQDRVKLFLDQFIKTYNGSTNIVTSEYNSENVRWACDTYGLTSYYYFFHGWAALDWYRGYNRTFLHQPKNIQHTFLCANNIVGGQRQHRLKLFKELEDRNLVKTNLISFPNCCPYENRTVAELCQEFNITNIETKLPLTIDNLDQYALNSHRIDMWEQASKSLVNVVTETVYNGKKNHLTEKTFKPIVLKQPFILVSCQNSLEYLRSYGFETFSSVWDESYDTLPDDQRISAIGNLLEELEHSNCLEWLNEQCAPIVEHNYNHFYGGAFEQILWDELTNMVEHW